MTFGNRETMPELMMDEPTRDHGGNLDAARRRWGGKRQDWVDLSTGINPQPYPLDALTPDAWTALPDTAAEDALLNAARAFWDVPKGLDIVAAPGASALIANLPGLVPSGRVAIPGPTYNEHAAAFRAHGWEVSALAETCQARVIVHPNNPDGALFAGGDLDGLSLLVIDESFADIDANLTMRALAHRPGVIILKSFGKFWGLAGLRLGFAIALPDTIAKLRDRIGPWAVSGPALEIGTRALLDHGWAQRTRARLHADAARLDDMVTATGAAKLVGGTPLFRLYDTTNAISAQEALGQHHVWTRAFPYSATWLRLGLPGSPRAWAQLETALKDLP
ncbi:MAG: cobalamin biosynthetic protein CobC [Dinoroseobacter sp.]